MYKLILKILSILAILILTISCVDGDRVNPLDAHCVDCGGDVLSSSSQEKGEGILSSSSAKANSSSSRQMNSSSSASKSPSSSSSILSSSSLQVSSSSVVVVYGPDVDYGGETYKTVVIGTQTWFARNLNYDPGTGNSRCYDNEPSNCEISGRLYDWETAMNVCPDGWHLPSDDEWNTLLDYIGRSNAGTKLRSVSWNGADTYGFSALPNGFYLGSSFYSQGSDGRWWSATEYDASNAYNRGIFSGSSYVSQNNDDKNVGFSVRCVQD
jgi:uncharacterized protein (TIGR02145 family)